MSNEIEIRIHNEASQPNFGDSYSEQPETQAQHEQEIQNSQDFIVSSPMPKSSQ